MCVVECHSMRRREMGFPVFPRIYGAILLKLSFALNSWMCVLHLARENSPNRMECRRSTNFKNGFFAVQTNAVSIRNILSDRRIAPNCSQKMLITFSLAFSGNAIVFFLAKLNPLFLFCGKFLVWWTELMKYQSILVKTEHSKLRWQKSQAIHD